MAESEVTRHPTLGREEARPDAEEIADNLKERLQPDYHWYGDHLRFKRRCTEGALHVYGEVIEISNKLCLMLKPMKGLIEGKIVEFLDKKLA